MRHGGNIFSVAAEEGVAWQQVLDFSASINPLGPSPAAREAMLAAIDRVAHYPEPSAAHLRESLAAQWNVTAARILMGAGATELLFDWCRWVGPGTIAAPAFGEFHRAWPTAKLCQIDDISTWPAEGPFVLTRPANPTGVLLDAALVEDFARQRSDAVLVDESFIDFCDAESLTARAKGNLFVLRSLTKFWALPGLRIGVLVGDTGGLAARRGPWAVNTIAEAAALASLSDRTHFATSRELVRSEREWLAKQLSELPGMIVSRPTANFLYCESAQAAELVAFARKRHLLLRDCSDWPGLSQRAFRVAVRPRWENEILVHVCREFLCA
ncbi:MAG: aminotransferase class I/II-fold pyridoxal phosphate-dependent enzyme [Acidobacteriota bacterium]